MKLRKLPATPFMMPRMTVPLIFLALLFSECSPEQTTLMRHTTAPNLREDGADGQTDRAFRIEGFRKKGMNRDLFNHIYFKGDTLGFFLVYNNRIRNATAKFINPLNHTSVPAERVEVKGNGVFGFILLGSLMENFFRDALDVPAAPVAFCCRNISYTVEVTVTAEKDTLKSEITDVFTIEFIN